MGLTLKSCVHARPVYCINHLPAFTGALDEIVFEALMLEDLDAPVFKENDTFINGLENFRVKIQENISISESMVRDRSIVQ